MLISVVATGVCLIKLGPHTQLKEYTQMTYQQMSQGFKVRVNRKLQELILEVIEDAEALTPQEQEMTKSFMANEFDIYCWGGYFSSTGVLLSLPHFFAYEAPSDINLKNVTFGDRSADPDYENKMCKISPTMLQSDEAKVCGGRRILLYYFSILALSYIILVRSAPLSRQVYVILE